VLKLWSTPSSSPESTTETVFFIAHHPNPKINFSTSKTRLLTHSRSRDHVTPVLHNLHLLPIPQRIQYKVILLTHKAHHLAPSYLTDLFHHHTPSRWLRSSDANLLSIPLRIKNPTCGDRGSLSSPNTLSTDLCSFGVCAWEFGLGSPDSKGREDGGQCSHFSIPSTLSTDLCSFGVWTWEFGLGSPDSKGREDGLSAIGKAANLITSPHQLFLLMSLLQLFIVNNFLQSNKIWQPWFFHYPLNIYFLFWIVCVYIYSIQDCLRKLEYCDKVLYFL